jgi:hypothetical protein
MFFCGFYIRYVTFSDLASPLVRSCDGVTHIWPPSLVNINSLERLTKLQLKPALFKTFQFQVWRQMEERSVGPRSTNLWLQVSSADGRGHPFHLSACGLIRRLIGCPMVFNARLRQRTLVAPRSPQRFDLNLERMHGGIVMAATPHTAYRAEGWIGGASGDC